ASDLEINMATETDFTIGLRRELQSNPSLARDLYGSEALPMIFQYDPFNYWIESDAERNLLFTLNRLENVSPRIRYNLHDRGLVRPRAEVDAILADHRLSWSALSRSALSSSASSSSALGPKSSADTSNANGAPLPLPLLFHWGRQNSAVAFYGCKITPEDVQHTILAIPELASRVENFALHPYEDADANKRLELWFELKANVDRLEASEPLTSAVLQGLAHQNQDFRESLRMIPASRRPSLKIFPYGQSPISGQDVRIKRRYIV
ncbi:MAG TPA: hypothetical protein VFQ61_00375, partial [Polyangiaceae bacterium]|nr:hypothetical protein [Polyangiaceae bacterium]